MKRALISCLAATLVLTSGLFSFVAADTATGLADVQTSVENYDVKLDVKTPTGILVDGGYLYVVDQASNRVVRAALDANAAVGTAGYTLNAAQHQAASASDNVRGYNWELVAGKTLPRDRYSQAAGGYLDGISKYALFNSPNSIVKYGKGYAVSDTGNNVIRYIIAGQTRTLSGSGEAGFSDGRAAGASFNAPTGLAVDPEGNLYIADTGNNAIRCMDTNGNVTTLITGLAGPRGLVFAGGTLYITDTGRQRILKYNEKKELWMRAGDRTSEKDYIDANRMTEGGNINGNIRSARFDNPIGITAGEDGATLYVGDTGNNSIRKISGEEVSTIAQANSVTLERFPGDAMALCYWGGQLFVADAAAGITAMEVNDKTEGISASKTFGDVPATAWYSDAVTYAYNHGLFNGTSPNSFSPQGKMTRGMFVTVISRLYGETYPGDVMGGSSTFADVAENQYFAGPAAWAAERKIIGGIGGGLFAPNENVTRQQMSVIMYNYAKNLNMDITLTDTAIAKFNAMPDADKTENWAKEAMIWAMGHDILKGKDGNLAPEAAATRAEVAQIVKNFASAKLEKVEEK